MTLCLLFEDVTNCQKILFGYIICQNHTSDSYFSEKCGVNQRFGIENNSLHSISVLVFTALACFFTKSLLFFEIKAIFPLRQLFSGFG